MANVKCCSEGPSKEGGPPGIPHLSAGPEEKGSSVKTKTVSSSTASGDSLRKRSADEIGLEDESKSKPAPPKMSKAGFSMTAKKSAPISIKLGASKPKEPTPALPAKKAGLASVFNEDDDSEPEEMPPEAKMRMKNIGRETPTSAGPNSFNKGKQGFSDHQKLWERKLKSQADQ
ncbi:PEST proteolytic signal-containing nuclear protein-like isoform X1 [Sinocyclocheilus rhinocerous]|uniref:PEST proteolytic signal-containing nuclear protein-like isoform X1 n=1 Tax=Sinocyclocheilus grahami TaxID=75366 RepID=UPI0007AC9E1C|nr:PREDICTED: PEST proteolytic signal-containing nuclear protein-like isoform X1 [Sinocyclocheilus grahami]XP_016364248.1 PREDICTED: PEST proteolytic signal-containing nuclear protein-like isoform X1 [Sinocyclocheilus rhinocerous]